MSRTLYYAQRSPYARKVRIVLAEKNLSYTAQEVDLANRSAEFYQLSPIGKIPVFVDENGTTLWDSTLIVEYLDEVYPEPSFYPASIKLQCRQWEELGDAIADNSIALWMEKRKGEQASVGNTLRLQKIIDRLLGVCEQKLVNYTYLMGDDWTIVDISVLSALGYLSLRISDDWKNQYPFLAQWFANLELRPSIQLTVPIA
ncbi:glutathione S-transferase [Synechococcus sp. PCC 7502]|uniref:glutathione S-transferase family protein n=1 Tax=Synechococcus sp. PCC 7502 TaxID=1173263 RepID=UPI00029FC95A|nr:glutathione S-transferase family protein [Synechococcus sp. PCC 7502]AFY72704.1 glutathione S-transferase [Synechococcus sp. PCC 7502]